jgi:hypothetical protein
MSNQSHFSQLQHLVLLIAFFAPLKIPGGEKFFLPECRRIFPEKQNSCQVIMQLSK